MGSIWLHDWPDAIRDYGVEVDFWPGWELRSRISGGFEAILALGIHHDAVPAGTSSINRHSYAWNHAPAKPIGNAALKQAGGVTIGAAGATNTQGASEQGFWTSKGYIPQSQGNLYMISLEAENNGLGEIWSDEQLEDYEKVMAATCDAYNLNALTDIYAHHRYTNRKIDPKGPTPGRPTWGGPSGTYNKWDDATVGFSVALRQIAHSLVVQPEVGEDKIVYIVKPGATISAKTNVHFAVYESGIVRHAQGPDTFGVLDVRECQGKEHYNGYVRAANFMSGANLKEIV